MKKFDNSTNHLNSVITANRIETDDSSSVTFEFPLGFETKSKLTKRFNELVTKLRNKKLCSGFYIINGIALLGNGGQVSVPLLRFSISKICPQKYVRQLVEAFQECRISIDVDLSEFFSNKNEIVTPIDPIGEISGRIHEEIRKKHHSDNN